MNREKKVAMALALIGKGVDAGDPRFAAEAGQKLYLFDMDPVNWEVCRDSNRADVQDHLAQLLEVDEESYHRAAKAMCLTAAALEARKAIEAENNQ